MAFNRYVEIIAGQEGVGKAVTITDLYIKFEVEKNISSALNTAKVDIYNLSDLSIEKIAVADSKLVINAGYLDETINAVFFGNIIKANVKQENGDKILTIEAQDGNKNYKSKKISISFKAGIKVSDVLNMIFSNLSMPVSGKNLIPKSQQYTIGYSFCGATKDALTDCLAACGLSWTIQNETIVILKDLKSAQETGLVLTKETGLLSIELGDENTGIIKKTSPKKFTIKTLLLPQLVPNAKCKIVSEKKNINGLYKIMKGKYTGDNQTGEFISELEVTAI